MQRRFLFTTALAAIALSGCASLSGAGWTTLIDGNAGLDNWNRVGEANWRAENGALVADRGAGGFLVSRKSYRDFELRAEFWSEPTTNSGIYMRVQDPAKITDRTAYEANIYEQRPDPTYGTGAIVHLAPVTAPQKTAGRWNTYEITARGDRVVVVLNGVQTADLRNSQFAAGPVALQFGAGPKDAPVGAIKWRKVQIREL